MISASDILHGTILIVDDQQANVILLERMLSGAGYVSITSTMDPAMVCELHRKNRYNVILLDLQMPGMDGFQVMEGLKEIAPGGYLPVLVITAQPDHKLRALKAGARDFISKPFELAEVLMRVRNMLEVGLMYEAASKHGGLPDSPTPKDPAQPAGAPPPPARMPAAAVRVEAATGAGLRTLLYVEDNPANLTLVEQLIARRSDIRLLTAVNGTLGIALAKASRPEAILMDINLPGISGVEALRLLRDDPATSSIPVVALSANAMPRDIQKGLDAGFFRYLTKPIKVGEFMDTVDAALALADKRHSTVT